MTCAEAWAAGTPLVAAAARGPAAYVRNEENGMLVPLNDPDAPATAIIRMIADTSLCSHLAIQGKKDYQRQFTKGVYVRAMRALYDSIIEPTKM
jgi:glycosyltransferase involved in cell wall biosynthesis